MKKIIGAERGVIASSGTLIWQGEAIGNHHANNINGAEFKILICKHDL